jgi:23S rRNA (adenine1618-N6)-methyltransferase
VLALNTALLKYHYHIDHWSIPADYLCPPIPGRADYIHYMADLIGLPANPVHILDIGVGANCIYPLIAVSEYKWNVLASDIDPLSIKNAQKIIDENKLNNNIKLKLQPDPKKIFTNIVESRDRFSFCICNPPFHSSQAEAIAGTQRKNRNLKITKDRLNFGGKSNELWCDGGEVEFISLMIRESLEFRDQIKYFTSLVSKSDNLGKLISILKKYNITNYQIIDMQQGQKKSRVLVWSF